ncbi:ABC transporter permease [Streptomyces radicis]|uniref:ABC transporter permease n=1 Tax=Streptomyces radicis TaxID=1750517 RepID=A0A3A9WDZ9_9ACTN|nr:ABC transporter permease [Streptomyces radicis]RKN07644.1 ABC transporter permease [Streptomyces radicis]RKN18367.1 ABC transporter permease [Streptomyces radicis]
MSERSATSLATWARELALGARFAVTGGPGLTRTALTAFGVGLGVVVLLLAASVPTMLSAREDRGDDRNPDPVLETAIEDTPAAQTFQALSGSTEYHGEEIGGWVVQPHGGAATEAEPPPGLDAFPAPGEMAVSPALARLLESDEGALLAERLDHPVGDTIGDEGLQGPGDLYYYLGSDTLDGDTLDGEALDGDAIDGDASSAYVFGDMTMGSPSLPAPLILLIVVICVVLLMPIAVFVATAVRFGGERRDQRLAALRLVGADIDMTRRVAAGETLVGAVAGLLLGGAAFLLLRAWLGTVTVWGFSAFSHDIVPALPLAALILVGVPVAAVVVSLLALRGIAIEPLGVVRDATERRRRLVWRLVPGALGVVLLAPMLGGSFDGGSTGGQVQAAVGVVLLLVAATVLLPWVVERVVARLRGGPVSWQLATRRLQLSSGAAARTVSGITVAVAGATALYMLFMGVSDEETEATGQDPDRAQIEISESTEGGMTAVELSGELEGLPGVAEALAWETTSALPTDARPVDGITPSAQVLMGDCSVLRELARIERCADGDVFVPPGEGDPWELAVEPGQQLILGVDSEGVPYGEAPVPWTLPEDALVVEPRTDPGGYVNVGVLATPGALDEEHMAGGWTRAMVRTEGDDPDTLEHVRNVAWGEHRDAWVFELESQRVSDELADVQRALLIGATGVMAVITASMIVSMLEQLRERRRLLSALVAFGTRRRTLSASLLWQTAVPVVLGLGLAAIVGTGLGALLMSMVDLPIGGWLAFLPMAAVGAGMIATVTLVSLPLLWHLMRPDGLRTE